MLLLVFALGTLVTSLQPQLVERTLAIVAGQAITLTDVQTVRALGLVDAADVPAATERLVDRALMLREVERYAVPEPQADTVDRRIDEIRLRLGEAEFRSVLAEGGFSERRLRVWVRDDLRIAAYLEQRFAAAAAGGQSRDALIADWIGDLRRRTPIVELWKK
jgi:hypothetical protein